MDSDDTLTTSSTTTSFTTTSSTASLAPVAGIDNCGVTIWAHETDMPNDAPDTPQMDAEALAQQCRAKYGVVSFKTECDYPTPD